MSREFPQFAANIGLGDHSVNAVCSLCHKILSADSDSTDDLEAISICGDCKFLFLEDLDTPSRESRRRRPPSRRRNRYSSNESIENLFSQQFSHMINLVRQDQSTVSGLDELLVEGDPTSRLFQRTSTRTTPSGSGRWRRVFSDTESEGLDNVDSVYAENESSVSFGRQRFRGESDAISFTTYGGESDASVDLNGFLDQNEGSNFDSDTDIDPMHAGVNHWNSEDDNEGDDEDGEWEEGDAEEDDEQSTNSRTRARNRLFPNQSDQTPHSPESVDMIRTRSIFANLEEPAWVPEFGDPTDYLDSRGLEEFLLHLAEEDNSRRGAPPASVSFVNSLPRIVIKKEHEKNDGLACAICKDMLAIGIEVNQLPCHHLYHPSCILPWLTSRNSCPLCRYELPTDDKDYEEGKRHVMSRMEIRDARIVAEDSSVTFSDREDNSEEDHEEPEVSRPVRESGRGRWLFFAAAPIVGLVGIVLVLWLGNLRADGQGSSRNIVLPDHGQPNVNIAGSLSSRRESRNRRWWSFF